MIQKHIHQETEKQNNQGLKGLKAEFEKLKSEQVEKATTKIVNFNIIVSCGCGGIYKKYHAEVPIAAGINDGDYLDNFKPWMDNVEEGWV